MIRRPMPTTEKPDGDGVPFIVHGDHIEVKENAKLKPEEKALIEGG